MTTIKAETLEAADGLEAVDIVSRRSPDLVLLDLVMPGIGGLETLRRLREIRPDLSIIVITGHASEQARRELARHGVEVLTKPFSVQALADIVHRSWPSAA